MKDCNVLLFMQKAKEEVKIKTPLTCNDKCTQEKRSISLSYRLLYPGDVCAITTSFLTERY